MKYVVDTSIINKLVDGKIALSELPIDVEFIASHIQIDELNKTKDSNRRVQLLTLFRELDTEVVQTESFYLDTSLLSQATMSDAITFQSIKDALDAKKRKKNNVNDALIAEVAIKHGITLLTTDKNLRLVTESLGGKVKYWKP